MMENVTMLETFPLFSHRLVDQKGSSSSLSPSFGGGTATGCVSSSTCGSPASADVGTSGSDPTGTVVAAIAGPHVRAVSRCVATLRASPRLLSQVLVCWSGASDLAAAAC